MFDLYDLSITSILVNAPSRYPTDHEDGATTVLCALPLQAEVVSRLDGGALTHVLGGRAGQCS